MRPSLIVLLTDAGHLFSICSRYDQQTHWFPLGFSLKRPETRPRSWRPVDCVGYWFYAFALGWGYDLLENLKQKVRVCSLMILQSRNSAHITDKSSSTPYANDHNIGRDSEVWGACQHCLWFLPLGLLRLLRPLEPGLLPFQYKSVWILGKGHYLVQERERKLGLQGLERNAYGQVFYGG